MKKRLPASFSFLTTNETAKAICKVLFVVLIVFAALPASSQVSKSIIAKQLVQAKPVTDRPVATDLAEMKVSSETYSTRSGVSNVYFQQHINDIPVYNAILNVHVTKDNQLLTFGNRFVADAKSKAGMAFPSLTAEQAVEAAARQLGYTVSEKLVIKQTLGGAVQKVIFTKNKFSTEDIPVQLMWQPLEDSLSPTRTINLRLAWDLSIAEPGGKNWWSVRVDAVTGEILNKSNWVDECNFGELGDQCPHQPGTTHSPIDLARLTNTNNFLPIGVGTYNVFPIPLESPYYGGRQLLVSPADAIASPFGWHDTNGAAGAEFTTTQGNNVHAYTDVDADDLPDAGSSPDGGAGLLFDFPLDLSQAPATYRPAAVTNLFYMNNFMHDFAYKYGFDELNGNFQVNNYGHGGTGNDYVQAEAQDGSGTNNAFFTTPPEGQRPRMEMFIGTNISPNVDGDFDNGVIAHEYGHGISNRLTGGPANVSCLDNEEQMGEGWSDFFAIINTMKPGDVGATARPMGNYLFGRPINNGGIRPKPYSTDMNINNATYNTIKTVSVPHGVGYVWASMIWDMTWALMEAHGQATGYDEALNLVMEGMKLQPCSPGFTDGRNAILAADVALYGGANQCLIWKVFARRGLGFSASQGSSNDVQDGTQAFDLPATCPGIWVTASAGLTVCENSGVQVTIGSSATIIGGTLTLSASGVPAGTTVSFGTNPLTPGNASTVTLISLTTLPGVYTVTITATNGSGSYSTKIDYTILNRPDATTLIAPADLATGVNLKPAFSWTAVADAPFTWLYVSTVANFATTVINQSVTGTTFTPTTPLLSNTTYYWRVATYTTTCTAFSTINRFTTFNCPTITVNNPATTTFTVGTAFSQTFTQTGGNGTITFSTTSLLPAGLTLSASGVLSGTPTVIGTFPIVVKVTDGNGCSGTGATYSLFISGIIINASAPVVITAENAIPLNNVPDPGETLVVNLPLVNVGNVNTTNLVATLQATGGVTNPGSPQTYGAVGSNSPSVAMPFTFTAAGNCGDNIILTLALQDGATNLGTIAYTLQLGNILPGVVQTFSNTTPIVIPSSGSGSPYPSNITVSGFSGGIYKVTVKLKDFSHSFPQDVDVLLVSPTGQKMIIMSDAGAGVPVTNADITLDDAALDLLPDGTAITTGTYKPSNFPGGDVFDAPAPAGPYLTPATDGTATLNSAFAGQDPNGSWSLYVIDNTNGDAGNINGGWEISFTPALAVCSAVPTTPLIIAAAPVVITAENAIPANNRPDPGETVTLNLPLQNIGAGNTTNLVATLLATGGVTNPGSPQTYGVVVSGGSSVARPYTFTAVGNCGDNITLSLALQDGATNLGTITYTLQLGTGGSSGLPVTFSNTTAIIIPSGSTAGAPANPYPSNITVSGLTGTISKVTVKLNQFNHTYPGDVDVLLVSPTGQKMIIMSDADEAGIDAVNINITLDDAAGSSLPAGVISSGSYKPTNITAGDLFPASAPGGPYLSPAPDGTATFASAFNGFDPNGTWSLYVVDDFSGDFGNFNGGWEIAITTIAAPVCSVVPSAALTINDITHNEGNSGPTNYSFTVSLSSPAPPGGVTFDIGTQDNSATTANNDYVAKSLIAQTIPAGSSTYTFDVTVNGDNAVEPNESFFVNVTNVTGATLSDGQGEGTITNDDLISTSLTISSVTNPSCVGNIATFNATLTRTSTPTGPLVGQTVTFTFSGPSSFSLSATTDVTGTATVVTNFVFAGSYTVTASFANAGYNPSSAVLTHVVNTIPATPTITPGGPTTFCAGGSVTLTSSSATGNQWRLNGNPIGGETNQTYVATASGNYTVVLTSPGCPSASSAATTVTLNNCLSINDVTHNEGNSGPTTYSFTVSLSAPAGAGGVTFDIATANNTATTANNDYVAKSLSGPTIPAGSSTYTFDVTVNGDNTVEPDETFFVDITNAIGATVSDGQGAGTITNDDLPGVTSLSLVSNTNSSCAGVAVSFTATLAQITAPVGPIAGQSVTFTLTNPSVLTTTLTATTNAAGQATVTFGPGSFTTAGVYTVQASFAGSALYLASSSPVITHVVSTAPAFSICPSNQSVNALSNSCSNIVAYTATTTGTTVTYVFTGATTGTGNGTGSGSSFNIGVTTVTLTATNGCSGSATCTFTVTVVDAQNPSITCPANITQNNDPNQCGAVVTYAATASDNCPGVSVIYSPASGSFFPVGTTTVTATATDAAGRTASCTFTVKVKDTQNPTITCPSNIVVNNTANQCGAVVSYAATASDNCPGVSVIYSPASGSFFPVGTTTVTATATDAANNTATCTFTVKVNDTQNPTISCPSNIIKGNDVNQCGAVVTYAATATDNCTGTPTIIYSPASGSFFPVGTTTVTATATDAANNTSTCIFTVTVNDVQVPAMLCKNITVALDAFGNASITPAMINNGSTDNCGIFSVTASPLTFTCANVGANAVTLKVIDVNFLYSVCTATVTVVDNIAPILQTCPGNITADAIAGLCGRVVTYALPTFTDNSCGTVTMTQTDGTGISSGQIFPVGVTTQTYTIKDASGNTTICSFTVTIKETQAPILTGCPGNITINAAPGLCSAIVNWLPPTASDNCPGYTLTTSHLPASSFPVGVTTVTYTVKDASNNTTSCSFTVTVVDAQPPVITCPANKVVNNTTNQCGAVVTFAATATDNCSGVSVGYSPASGSLFPVGTTTVTATATDVAGNTSSCTFTVKVVDVQAPSITCPANITVNNTTGLCGAAVSFSATATDNCPGVSISYSAASGSVFPVGTTIVKATATDAANNKSYCTFTVTVVDAQAPVITCPADIVQSAGTNCSKSIAVANPATLSDNCSVTKLTWAMTGATTGSSSSSGMNYVGTKTFNVGVTTVNYTAKDAAGNATVCSFTVTVTGTGATLSISCPQNKSVSISSGQCYATVNLGTPSTTGCGTLTVTNNAPSQFPVGVTMVTWTVTNSSGNTATCQQTVTVTGGVSLSISCPQNKTVSIAAGQCYATNVNLGTPSITGCGTLTVTNDAPLQFPAGITYVTWTVTGNNGSSKTCTQKVTVTGGVSLSISCPPNKTVNISSTACYATNVILGTPVTTGCGALTVTNNAPAQFPAGITNVTWTVTDTYGNSKTCTQTVTVTGGVSLSISCPPSKTVNANTGYCYATNVILGTPVTTGCGTLTITNDAPTQFPAGTTTVTWKVKDANNNQKTCTQTVTVVDNQNPVITCPANITQAAPNGQCGKSVSVPNPVKDDNCGIVKQTWTMSGATSGSSSSTGINTVGTKYFYCGTTTVTYKVWDASGKTATCSFTVYVSGASNCFNNTRLITENNVKQPGGATRIEVTVFPNPTENYFNLKVSSRNKETIEVRVYDVLGKVVQIVRGAPDQTYRLGDHVVSGMYIVEVRQAGEVVTAKVIKQ